MIKLLGILLPLVSVCAQPNPYLLPDDNEKFLHFLTRAIETSSDSVLITTPSLHHGRIKKALVKTARKGTHVRIVAGELDGDPLYLAQYRGIDLYRYAVRPIGGSVILLDARYVCFLPGSLDETAAAEAAALVICSERPSDIRGAAEAMKQILKRSSPYLK